MPAVRNPARPRTHVHPVVTSFQSPANLPIETMSNGRGLFRSTGPVGHPTGVKIAQSLFVGGVCLFALLLDI